MTTTPQPPNHLRVRITRTVTKDECSWLDRDIQKDEIWYRMIKCSYGCTSSNGTSLTLKPDGDYPGNEVPNNAFISEPVERLLNDGPSREAMEAADEINLYQHNSPNAQLEVATIIHRHFQPLREENATIRELLARSKPLDMLERDELNRKQGVIEADIATIEGLRQRLARYEEGAKTVTIKVERVEGGTVGKGETPKSEQVMSVLAETFAQYAKGEIYMEDMAVKFVEAKGELSYLEHDLAAVRGERDELNTRFNAVLTGEEAGQIPWHCQRYDKLLLESLSLRARITELEADEATMKEVLEYIAHDPHDCQRRAEDALAALAAQTAPTKREESK